VPTLFIVILFAFVNALRYRMRVKDTALIGKRWGCRFEVVKGKGAILWHAFPLCLSNDYCCNKMLQGLVEIDDVDTTAEVEEEADVKPSEQELCDNR
jgi:hypothetical protein